METLQAQNDKLNAALLQMRDLADRADAEREETIQELEELRKQNDEVHEILLQTDEQLQEAKKTISFYQEQIDASLGSAKLIEELTEKILELEEKVRLNEDAADGFENLSRMFDEMSATYKQSEKEHREEIERLEFTIEELKAEAENSDELLRAAESVIIKFRHKNSELKEKVQERDDQILRLQEGLAQVANGDGTSSGLMAFNQNRTFVDTVQYELAQLKLEYSIEHTKYLEAFFPESFSKVGGDKDLLLTHLAFPRIAAKAKLLMNLLVKKYPDVPGGIRREHVIQAHKAEQWAHVDRFAYSLQALYTIVRKLASISKLSTVERLSKLAIQQIEIAQHEKLLDQYFELLKMNRIDENTSVENIQRVTIYFQNVCAIHLSADEFDTNEFVSNTISEFQAAFRWLLKNVQRLKFALNESEAENNAFCSVLSQISSVIKDADALAIRANNCVPKDKDIILTTELSDMLLSATSDIDKITQTLNFACANSASQLSILNDDDDGLSSSQMFEIFHNAVEKIFGSIQASETTKSVLSCAKNIHHCLKELSVKLDKGEIERSKTEREVLPPIVERTQSRKKDAADAETLRWQLQKKNNEVVEVNKLLKSRVSELGATKVRLEIAEKKLSEVSEQPKDDKLENQYRKLQEDYEKLTLEYEKMLNSCDEVTTVGAETCNNGKKLSSKQCLKVIPYDFTKCDCPMGSEKINQVNERMAALLLQFDKLKAKEDEKDILGLPELKVPLVADGPYSAYAKNQKSQDNFSVFHKKARELQKQFGRMLIEPLNPNQKSAYDASLVAYQERVERLCCEVESAYARIAM